MEYEVFIPHSVTELYEKMIGEQFTGQIEIKSDSLIWTLDSGIVLEIVVDNQPQEGYIGINYLDYKKRTTQLTHWHPMEYEIYRDLWDINTGQTFWVKKKRSILWRYPLIMDRRVWEGYSEKRKSKYVIL